MSNKSLSILIPNYNGRKLLEDFLPHTFIAAKNSKLPFEIIIVDDASTDDSVSFIKSEYPEIILHTNTVNQGFSKSCNAGIRVAKNQLLLILNSDIKLSPNYFLNQVKYFDIPSTFGVMSKIEDHNNPTHIERSQTLSRFGYKVNRKSINCTYLKNELYPTAFLSGANALVDLDKIKTLGGFNELFSPFYFEDFDLSIRAWRMGWRCYFDNFSSCDHLGSFSIKNNTRNREIKTIYYRNRFILNALHLTNTQNVLFDFQSIIFVVLPKIFTGKFWILKSYSDYLKYKKDIHCAKNKFEKLIIKHKSDVNLWDIEDKIRKLQPK